LDYYPVFLNNSVVIGRCEININFSIKNVFILKIITTFAPIMMKSVFCILFGTLLMLGFHYAPDKKVREVQPEAGTVAIDMPSDTRSELHLSVSTSRESYGGSHSFDSEVSDYTIDDGLLGELFSFRNITPPSKVLKINSATIMQMLCLSDTQLSENKWRGLSPDTNYIKYSNGYYVYTLGHILI
jgi:hypothetical protein